jgi:hypothetical protein
MFNFNTFYMKNLLISSFLAVLILACIFWACDKKEVLSTLDSDTYDMKRNEATWVHLYDNSKGAFMELHIWVGHTAEQCGNSCIKIFGVPGHADCRSFGNICNYRMRVEVIEDLLNDELSLLIIDDGGLGEFDVFPFPDRSFHITNPLNNMDFWLNVPEQLLAKDSATMEVMIYDVWFSEDQELENE